jgi:hypothetical protein
VIHVRFFENARSLDVEESAVTTLSSGIVVVNEGRWFREIESAILLTFAGC